MKLALLYTYFDGFEQLIDSMGEMVDRVDSIYLCYQRTSNKGNVSKSIDAELLEISKRFPSVNLLEWSPNLKKNTNQNEREKHDFMIQTIKKTDSTHFILTACDHVYTLEHLTTAKNRMIAENLDVCFTRMFTYYKNKNWRLEPLEDYFMPFIHKLHRHTKITRGEYPCYVDPSVKVNTCERWHIFEPSECVLHHFSMIRTDIEKKFNNSAASVNWTPQQIETFISEYNGAKLGDKITYFQGRTLVETSINN